MNTEKNTEISYRIEHDSMGELKVPKSAFYGAQTQRAINNFKISSLVMPTGFIKALGFIKSAAAMANTNLGELEQKTASLISKIAIDIANGQHGEQFPIDIFQTGSGTSTNMNINEVIANLANASNPVKVIHPNDHVNMGQSSNDTIPTAVQVSASLAITNILIPNLEHLENVILKKAKSLNNIVKTGRTHLMDAMPIRFDQELGTWAAQINSAITRLKSCLVRLTVLPQGGTAIGTGINAHPDFANKFCQYLSESTKIKFTSNIYREDMEKKILYLKFLILSYKFILL